MSFKGTAALYTKAMRAPLTSKIGNKEFYKGTGSFPGLGKKRIGRHGSKTGSKAPYIIMPERTRTFVVPSTLHSSEMKPYVAKQNKLSDDLYPSWPRAETASYSSKRNGFFGPKGFDGHYYLQLVGESSSDDANGGKQ